MDCGYKDSGTEPPLGHDYTKYENIGDSQKHKAICSRCGDEITEAHTFKDVKEDQTCVTPEAVGERCTKCKYDNLTITQNATGHKFGIGSHTLN